MPFNNKNIRIRTIRREFKNTWLSVCKNMIMYIVVRVISGGAQESVFILEVLCVENIISLSNHFIVVLLNTMLIKKLSRLCTNT